MENHLKDRSYYENLYERKMIENQKYYYDKFNNSNDNKEKWILSFLWCFIKMSDYKHRDETINKWMEKDKNRDIFYQNTKPIRDIVRCKFCNKIMELEDKDYSYWTDWKNDKILFIYRCNECKKWRAFYNTWEEFETAKNYCKKCWEIIDYTAEFEWDILVKNFSCDSCWEKYIEKEDFSSSYKEEKITEKDIDLHWYKEKEAYEMIKAYNSIDDLKNIMDWIWKKDENDIYKEKIKEIEKLNLYQLEKLINEKISKLDFINFKIINKEQVKTYMKCEFEVYYTWSFWDKTNKKFDKILNDILSNSNWKVQDNKTSEKLGLLNGFIFGYDIESDLIELVKKREK